MLYVTTRSDQEIFTASHALNKNRAEDGGLYVPFKMPRFHREDLVELADMPFNQRLAKMLNLLFGTKITGWDLDFATGRSPVRICAMNHRMLLGQLWHNPDWCADRMIADILKLLRGRTGDDRAEWAVVGVRAAVLAAMLGELKRSETERVDVALVSGDFSGCMAAWYVRSWGFPVGNIVVACNENAGLWDLIHRGELRTGQVAVSTATPECDQIIPRSLERLIYAGGGSAEVARFLEICRRGGLYCPGNDVLHVMRKGLFVRVVGSRRVASTIPNVCTAGKGILGPYDALAYCALLDYRAGTGESRPALILSDRSPIRDADMVALAMGVSKEQLLLQIK